MRRHSLAAIALLSPILLAVLVQAGAAEPGARPASRGKTWSFSFEADTLGRPPASAVVSGGTWVVAIDSSNAGAPRILRQTEADDGIAYHRLQFLKPYLADQEIEVRFRIRSGAIDPSVGIAFQLDPKGKDGYLVRVTGTGEGSEDANGEREGAKGELIAHYLLSGRRRDLKFERIQPPRAGEWHTLGVRRRGEVIEARYDGVLKLRIRDERFARGWIGLWTEDDTVADFAGLTVRSL